jgi:eukaryotic-like serine/threonine-protein kinase
MASGEKLLAGRYELRRALGAGMVGEVYEARDRELDRRVAVKLAHPYLASDEAFRDRFGRAARQAAGIQHPNVVVLYDMGGQARPFVVVEHVDGRSLRGLLRGGRPLEPDTAMRIAMGVCSGLSAVHAAGLVHGDVTPPNLLLGREGDVKVADVGLAAATLGSRGLVGAAGYLSPEQTQAGVADDRSDVYSLGCCLYEMVTGRPPFDGPTPFAIAACHLREPPPPPRTVNAAVPPALEAVILQALAKNPNDRHQTPVELRRALQYAAVQPRRGPTQAPRTTVGAPPADPPGTGGLGLSPPDPLAVAPREALVRALTKRPDPLARLRPLGPVLAALLLVLLAAVVVRAGQAPGGAPVHEAATPAQGVQAQAARRVPPVVGVSQAQATRRLLAVGLKVGAVRHVRDEAVAEGRVVRIDPAPGSMLRKGARVRLVVADGAGPATVQELIALVDRDPAAAGPRGSTFRGRLARLDELSGLRRRAEVADLLAIARAGAHNGDFTPRFSGAAVAVLSRLAERS